MPRIRFLLPVYNGAAFLRAALESVLSQTVTDFEIDLIDDGSTDETAKIVEQFKDPRICYRYQDNQGLVATLNAAIETMDCEYVARMDADDICFPNRLERQLDFVRFTNAVAVSSRAMNINEHGAKLGVNNPGSDFRLCDPKFVPAREPYLPHPFLFMRLDVLRNVGGFRQVHLAEDSDLCWRFFDYERIALQDEVLGKYRVHMNSVASNDLAGIRVQSFYSQLAALNADRRRNGLEEIWPNLSLAEAKALGSFDDLLGALKTDDKEFKNTVSAMSRWKYLDISNWRHFKLERSDIDAACHAAKKVVLSEENQTWHETILGHIQNRQPDLF